MFPLPGTLFPQTESGGACRASLNGKPYGSPSLNHILSPATSLCPPRLLHFALWHCQSLDTVQVYLFSATLLHTQRLPWRWGWACFVLCFIPSVWTSIWHITDTCWKNDFIENSIKLFLHWLLAACLPGDIIGETLQSLRETTRAAKTDHVTGQDWDSISAPRIGLELDHWDKTERDTNVTGRISSKGSFYNQPKAPVCLLLCIKIQPC